MLKGGAAAAASGASRSAATTLAEQARQWEAAGDFNHAVDCYIRLVTQSAQLHDSSLLEKACIKVFVVFISKFSWFLSLSLHLHNFSTEQYT